MEKWRIIIGWVLHVQVLNRASRLLHSRKPTSRTFLAFVNKRKRERERTAWHNFPARVRNNSLRDAGASVATRYLACHWLPLSLYIPETHVEIMSRFYFHLHALDTTWRSNIWLSNDRIVRYKITWMGKFAFVCFIFFATRIVGGSRNIHHLIYSISRIYNA